MQLVDKINELNTTAQKLETALQTAQTLQDERIKAQVGIMKNDVKTELVSELEPNITQTLKGEFESIVEKNTRREVLNQIFVDNVENNAQVMNRVLDLAEFDERIQKAIDEWCNIYMNTYNRYQNSYAVLAVCLQNELAAISEAMNTIAITTLAQERLTSGEPVFKIYHEI